MTDVHDRKTRSYNMSRIKGKDTKPEIIVRKFLFRKGLRYRLHVKSLPGKPDIVLPKYKSVVFVHGCFWHGHEGCRYFIIPKTRSIWWTDKIQQNRIRDKQNCLKLKEQGWKVFSIFTCELKKDKYSDILEKLISSIKREIQPRVNEKIKLY